MTDDILESAQRKPNFFQTLKAVSWAFFGVRKGKDYSRDVATLNPIYLIIAGGLATAVFVGVLIFLARWAVLSAL
ncbi:MAG: DUF2970 domain-containing protein [Paralcaligenes sp.]